MRARRVAALLFAVGAIVSAALVARPYVHGLSFVIRAADIDRRLRRVADFDTVRVHTRELSIPTTRGAMRARAYEPEGAHRRAALLTSGLHASGIDEPRLVRLAQQIAASHVLVVTPDIPELSRFEITPAITDAIEEAGRWLAIDSGLAPDHRVGLMGVSFSGGLSIVAAARPSIADRVAYVFALGGHNDLPRVLRYLCTGREPRPAPRVRLAIDTGENDTFVLPPHDYGVAVILLSIADRVVPAVESEYLAEDLRGHAPVRLLLSGLISHAEADRPAHTEDIVQLAGFWGDLLAR